MSAKKSLFVLGAFAGWLPSSSEGEFPLSVEAVRLSHQETLVLKNIKGDTYMHFERPALMMSDQPQEPADRNDILSTLDGKLGLLQRVLSTNPTLNANFRANKDFQENALKSADLEMLGVGFDFYKIRKAVAVAGDKDCGEEASLSEQECKDMFGGRELGRGTFVKAEFKTAKGENGCYARKTPGGWFSSEETKVLFGPRVRVCKEYACGAVCKQRLSATDQIELLRELYKRSQPRLQEELKNERELAKKKAKLEEDNAQRMEKHAAENDRVWEQRTEYVDLDELV